MKHIITYIFIGCCTYASGQNISGQVFWPNGELVDIPLVLHVKYEGCQQMDFDHDVDNGSFNFHIFVNPLLDCEPALLSLSGTSNVRAAVSTLDLVRLAKHLLGISPFTNALQYMAADVNNSQSLSALDLVEIRKVILGLIVNWPTNNSLKFFHKTTPSAPSVGTQLTSVVTIPLDNTSRVADFWAVKTGDVK